MIKGDAWLAGEIPADRFAAVEVIKAIRKDGNAKISLKAAIAINELAHALGLGPVFTARNMPAPGTGFEKPVYKDDSDREKRKATRERLQKQIRELDEMEDDDA